MRLWIYLFMILLMLSSVTAIDLCSDEVKIYSPCRLITPSIECDIYNYTIYDVNGDVITQNNLSLFADSMYYTDITLSNGNYIVQLCNEQTREIRVLSSMEDEKMGIGEIIFLIQLLIVIGILFYKLFNILYKGQLYGIEVTFITFVSLCLAYGIGLVISILSIGDLLYIQLFRFETFGFIIGIFFSILEFVIFNTAKIPIYEKERISTFRRR